MESAVHHPTQVLIISPATLWVPAFFLLFFPLFHLSLPTVLFVSSQFYTSWLCRKEECFIHLLWMRVAMAHEYHNVVSQGLLLWTGPKAKRVIRVSWCLFLLFRILHSLDLPFLNMKDHFVSLTPGSKPFSGFLLKKTLPDLLSQSLGGWEISFKRWYFPLSSCVGCPMHLSLKQEATSASHRSELSVTGLLPENVWELV